MPYVYILKSLRDGKYYIGSTNNINQRLKHHLNGSTPSTKRFGGVELVFKQEYNLLKEAKFVERRLKKLRRKDYIENIIRDGFIKVNLLK